MRVWSGSERTTERTGRTQTDACFEKHADEMHMMTLAKFNMQANDMAMTANNWQTPGALDPGRYNSPPLTRDLVPRSQERDRRERGRGEVRTQERR